MGKDPVARCQEKRFSWLLSPGYWRPCALRGVIHLELDRVRRHAEALHLFVLEGDVRIDHVVREDAAAREDGRTVAVGFSRS